MAVKYGIVVPLISQIGKEPEVIEFLNAGHSIVLQHEPDTIQWFAMKYNDDLPNTTFAIFDTFTSEAGRKAHLEGQVPVALSANAAKLFTPEPVDIRLLDVLASKVEKVEDGSKTTGLTVGLRVLIEAKPDKVEAVKNFLINALPLVNEESETPVWYATHVPGTNHFGILDFFANEEGRNAHLNGKVAAALFSSVDELLAGTPNVLKLDALAAKISG